MTTLPTRLNTIINRLSMSVNLVLDLKCCCNQVEENVSAAIEFATVGEDNEILSEVEEILKPVKNQTWPSGIQQFWISNQTAFVPVENQCLLLFIHVAKPLLVVTAIIEIPFWEGVLCLLVFTISCLEASLFQCKIIKSFMEWNMWIL